ncbi:MAG: NADH-quinone oxidoreductase subunit N, partial [Alphaproteobacteria bacterium MarineAlpha9_Bin5]
MNPVSDFFLILPELILLGAASCLLIFGVFRTTNADPGVTRLAVVFMGVSLVFVLAIAGDEKMIFEGLLITDRFGQFMKALVLVGAILTLVMGHGYREREGLMQFEYPVLIMFASLGMLLMVSANDLMSLYLGLELQSLPLYVIAAFNRDSERSSEAGLKYFVLGALSSGLLLYGCCLVYGFTGSTSFDGISAALSHDNTPSTGVVVGMVFL